MRHFAISTVSLTLARGLSFGGRAFTLLVLASTSAPMVVTGAVIAVTLADTARLVCDFGVEVWLIRAIGSARTEGEARDSADAGLALRMIGAGLAGLAVWTIARAVAALAPGLAAAATLLTVTGLISGVPIAVLQARLQLQRLTVSLIPILAAGFVVVAIAAHWRAKADALLLTLAAFECAAVCATLAQSKLAPSCRLRVESVRLFGWFRECVPIAIYNALVGTYTRLDVWFLVWLSAAALPTYTVAYRLYQPLGLFTAAMAGVAYASMARLVGRDQRSRFVVGRRLLSGLAVFGAILALSFLGISHWLANRLFPSYPGATTVLIPLAFLLPIVGFNSLCVAMLSARGRFTALWKLTAFNLVVFAVALFALISAYGATGAAIGLVIGETCSLCVLVWLVQPWVTVALKASPK